jgi:hypothetical protein
MAVTTAPPGMSTGGMSATTLMPYNHNQRTETVWRTGGAPCRARGKELLARGGLSLPLDAVGEGDARKVIKVVARQWN